jgi:hypothetical protein
MKTNTIIKSAAPALLFIACLLLPQTAHCLYNPSSGKWLSRDPIEESGGNNVYAFASNDSVNRVDILGLKIRCNCPESYFDSIGLAGKYQIVSDGLYAAKTGASFSGSGDGEIIWKMLLTAWVFKAENMNLDSLKKNVEARKTIVENAGKVVWGFGPEHFNHDPGVPLPSYQDDPQGFFNAINNAGTTTGCREATEIVFRTGKGQKARGKRPEDAVWVPGDWGYIANTAFQGGHWPDGDTFAGENVIHVGGQAGQERFWGHLLENLVLTKSEWWGIVRGWTSNDSPPKQGQPKWYEYIWYTREGLEY